MSSMLAGLAEENRLVMEASSHQGMLRRSPHWDLTGARRWASASVVAYMANRVDMKAW